MNRQEFMRRLERLLWNIPENDRLDAIAYYNDYFDEAGTENEAQVIRELGSPEKVAATIKANFTESEQTEYTEQGCYTGYDYTNKNVPETQEINSHKKAKKRDIPLPVIIICIIFASPILLGVGGGLLGGLIGLLGALFGIIIAVVACGAGLTIGGVVCLVAGMFRVLTNPLEGLITMGVGGVLGAAGLLLILLFVWSAFKWLPALFRACVNFCQRIFHRGERGNVA